MFFFTSKYKIDPFDDNIRGCCISFLVFACGSIETAIMSEPSAPLGIMSRIT